MIRTLAAALVVAIGVAIAAATGAMAQAVGIAASNPGSLYHTSASAVAKLGTS